MRPHVVWFGELVTGIVRAAETVRDADILVVVGTSLLVYPAAALIHEAPAGAERYLVNPEIPDAARAAGFECIRATAGAGVPRLVDRLLGGHD